MDTAPPGLTNVEAQIRLARVGANAVPDVRVHPWLHALGAFWSPVPWMLEAAALLELALGKNVEAVVIACLVVFNAIIGLVQEGRAQHTLAALRARLALTASARRDGAWTSLPAVDLVPGDVIKLSLGGVVAADARLISGNVLLDQSMLTGESVPVEAGAGFKACAGVLVRRGEAEAEVIATGARTEFGRTAELVRNAKVVSSQEKAVVRVVRNLVGFAFCVVIGIAAYAAFLQMPFAAILPLVLTAMLGAIPVALPATFTVAAAIGANRLAKLGVLPTRLSAVDEAGTMDVLCVDKTGTLTQDALAVAHAQPMHGTDAAHLLTLAALASSDGGQDPVDGAIRAAAAAARPAHQAAPPHALTFLPFDPATKMSAATLADTDGTMLRVVKGAFAVISAAAQADAGAAAAASALEQQGFRVLAVAVGPPNAMRLAGLIALSDPPRRDSATLVAELGSLGVGVVMVTGDAPATARYIANMIGMTGDVCPPGPIPPNIQPGRFAVFAGVLPEQKYKLVKAFQTSGLTVGMCGDGANDAPALRQAQIGIAVSTATDVAKSAAGMVLTEPGLAGIVAAVREGRATFQRIQTYTLNSIAKKILNVFFLLAGLIMTGYAVMTPLLMVILMIEGDFLAVSLTTDNVRASPAPNAWRIGKLTIAGAIMAVCVLAFCCGVLATGRFWLHLPLAELQTLSFLALVFGSQSMLYAIRGRPHAWSVRPSLMVVLSSCAGVAFAAGLATYGVAMAALPPVLVAQIFGAACCFTLVLDGVHWQILQRLRIDAD
jgi:H+-transporting ATPase